MFCYFQGGVFCFFLYVLFCSLLFCNQAAMNIWSRFLGEHLRCMSVECIRNCQLAFPNSRLIARRAVLSVCILAMWSCGWGLLAAASPWSFHSYPAPFRWRCCTSSLVVVCIVLWDICISLCSTFIGLFIIFNFNVSGTKWYWQDTAWYWCLMCVCFAWFSSRGQHVCIFIHVPNPFL